MVAYMKNNLTSTSRLMMGSAQFGSRYGIQNITEKIHPKEVNSILTLAYQKGITFIDTAHTYGSSEKIIGNFIRKTGIHFSIVSKLPSTKPEQVKKIIQESLHRTSLSSLYGYLIHDITTYKNYPSIYSILKERKSKGYIDKIGFSLYFPEDLEYLLKKNIPFDLIQLPFNCFDQRFIDYFPILKRRGVEIHVRSIFLQGLFFVQPNRLPAFFKPLSQKIHHLHLLAKKTKTPISSLCLLFTLSNQYIDKIIIGVDSTKNLLENLQVFNYIPFMQNIIPKLKSLRENDEKLIVPIYWPKKS